MIVYHRGIVIEEVKDPQAPHKLWFAKNEYIDVIDGFDVNSVPVWVVVNHEREGYAFVKNSLELLYRTNRVFQHRVAKGDVIKSLIESRIWIDIGETFVVEDIVQSNIDKKTEGVLFFDRHGGKRVFWNRKEYEIVRRKTSFDEDID